jgi:hypothetical protein
MKVANLLYNCGKHHDRPMPAMRIIQTTAQQWGVFVQMRGVLLKAGTQHQTQKEAGGGNAGGNRAISGEPWPGAHLGVRAPGIDETPLSIDECWIAVRECLT